MTTVNPIDIGSLPNDGTGDPLRVAFAKINDNFTYLGNLVPNGNTGDIQFIDANGYFAGDDNLSFDSANVKLRLGATIVPTTDLGIDIGTRDNRVDSLYLGNTLALGNISISESGNTISFPVTVLPSKQASFHMNDLTLDGNINIGGSLNLDALDIGKFSATTSNNDINQVVFQTPISNFNTGVFQLTSRSETTNASQTVTLSVTKKTDNTGVRFSAYATLFEGSPITRYNVDYGYANVRIIVNPILNNVINHTGTYEISKS
jgi:hypothetical protein